MNREDLDQAIGVHVGNPLMHLALEFPAGNYVGLRLLNRSLELALQANGLTGEDCCAADGVELNDLVWIARVADALAAAEIVKRELGALYLLRLSQIGVLGRDGWRCVYPSKEVRLNWLLDGERLELTDEKFRQAQRKQIAIWEEIQRRLQQRDEGKEGEKL
jgi:hypothetical protein